MAILEVHELVKRYPGFTLDGVSFTLERGRIMGLIGRNGAGKSTTLKSLFHLVQPDGGTIRMLGLAMPEQARAIKQRVGYAGGAVDYYKRKKIKEITAVTRTFYENWDDAAYCRYCEAFALDGEKTPLQLSEGMRVKYSLVLALSHGAELLILDEPTSGLDPVSRAELLETFRFLRDRGVSILFSSHITTDLEKCADDITYLKQGKQVASMPLQSFLLQHGGASLEEIMVQYEKESLYEKLAE